MVNAIKKWNRPGVQYEQVALIDYYWLDAYRPELFWRKFKPITKYDRGREAIYIFKRAAPAISNSIQSRGGMARTFMSGQG